MSTAPESIQPVRIPRIAITYCTKCKWMLRAAYYAQELQSTFDLAIGEIALIPTAGGIFHIYLTHQPSSQAEPVTVLLWDYKIHGGFPETKILKQKLRDQIQPDRQLGHSDTPSRKVVGSGEIAKAATPSDNSTAAKTSSENGLQVSKSVSAGAAESESKVSGESVKCEECQ